MKSKNVILFLAVILSIMLLFVVNLFLYPFSSMGMGSTDYNPWILRFSFMNYPNLHASAIVLSVILLVGMAVIVRRICNSRLKRSMYLSIPLLTALFIHFLISIEIDTLFYHHEFIGFIRKFFVNLPDFFTAYIYTGLLLFFAIMLTCYPAGILIDKFFLYITSKMPKHSQG